MVEPASGTEASADDILKQVNTILEENKTLETVVQETEAEQNQKENEAALNEIGRAHV